MKDLKLEYNGMNTLCPRNDKNCPCCKHHKKELENFSKAIGMPLKEVTNGGFSLIKQSLSVIRTVFHIKTEEYNNEELIRKVSMWTSKDMKELMNRFNNTINKKLTEEQFNSINTKYETEIKNHEILLKNKDKELNNLKLEQQKIQNNSESKHKEMINIINGNFKEMKQQLQNELKNKDKELNNLKLEQQKTKNNLKIEIKSKYEEKYNDYDDLKRNMKKEKDEKEKLILEIEDYRKKEKYIPALKGGKAEKIVGDILKASFPTDEIIPQKTFKNEIDWVQKVKNNEIIVGKILIECKDTTRWSNTWLKKTKDHMKRENTQYAIIATKKMPNEKILSPLGLEKDGIFITQLENVGWTTAFMRLAILKTSDAFQQLNNQKEKLSKQTQIRKKLSQILKSEDFKTVFEACREIEDDAQKIRNCISKTATEIKGRADNLNNMINTITIVNTKLKNAFDSLAN